MRFTITVELPDGQVADLARLIASHLADSCQPPAPEAPPGRPGRSADGTPTDGRTLLGWADRHGLRDQVVKLGRARKYPGRVLDWTPEQVADCFHEVASKPRKGSQDWGGAVGVRQVGPK